MFEFNPSITIKFILLVRVGLYIAYLQILTETITIFSSTNDKVGLLFQWQSFPINVCLLKVNANEH